MLRMIALSALIVIAPNVFSPFAYSAEPARSEIEVLDPNFAVVEPGEGLQWFDATSVGLEGQGWEDSFTPYHRMPKKAEGNVPPAVWNLSNHSAGLALRFLSDSSEISARWSVTGGNLGMPHMPATGVSGLDLYAKDGDRWRWVAQGRPSKQVDNRANLVRKAPGGLIEYMIYLPLYNGTTKLEVGVKTGSTFARGPKRANERPIVFYGTSITHGGCASRPGMTYPAILGQRLDRETINLGFSGNGKMEPEMGKLIAEIDASVFVLDCLPNMNAAMVTERVAPVVKILREAHPETPIVLVENIIYQNSWFYGGGSHEPKNEALQKVYAQLKKDGISGLSYVPCDNLLGDDGLATVDGTHPTDVGFLRQADALEPFLRRAVGKATQ
jgi:hypothetical protein